MSEGLRYFTGKPCKHGHIAERYIKSHHCVECTLERCRKHYHQSNGKEYHREYSKALPSGSHRRGYLKRTYGMTPESYDDMWEAQGGKCKICSKLLIRDGKRGAHIDHCHVRNVVRGILCGDCNNGIGHLQHSPDLIRKAAAYLEKHS